ncbi:hypothetical protein F5Y05DRAFT_411735 [Hypoxylon sp. FL0543]|nr:hypothetical protein F5Y05DRAFT_411735 [Hypoxylon sp. FL0543]
MGWMWSSQSAPSKGPGSGSGSSSNASDGSKNPPKQASSDYDDPEIAKFFAQLQAEFNNPADQAQPTASREPEKSTTAPTSTPPSSSSSSSSSSWTQSLWGSKPASPPNPDPTTNPLATAKPKPQTWTPDRLDPVSESLLPTTMSCRQAFDAAFHCNSLGGQFANVYRAGAVRSCSEHWDDFWFCMRARAYQSPHREQAVRAHYRRKEYAKYFAPGRPSSADVWEPRQEKVEPGTAFREPLDMPDVSDEEWRRREIERRRLVQEALGSRGS